MKRLTFALLSVMLLVPALAASTYIQTAPVQADTTYGCGTYPGDYNGDPIGGGSGYGTIYTAATADYVVTGAAELKAALAAATSGDVVYIADGATITITSSTGYSSSEGCRVKAGVTLAGGRGTPGVTGGVIQKGTYTNGYSPFIRLHGAGARITGLTVIGSQAGTTGNDHWSGVRVMNDGSEIDNCEIKNFGYAGVEIGQEDEDIGNGTWVHHNYIHHCRQDGFGYGVQTNNCCDSVLIEGNHFDYSRHHIEGERGGTGASWEARYNYLGPGGSTHTQIDQHGGNDTPDLGFDDGPDDSVPAGGAISVHHNTSAYDDAGTAFFQSRGIPRVSATVYRNWYLADTGTDDDDPVHEHMENLLQGYVAPAGGAFVKMSVYDNWCSNSAPPSTNRAPVLDAIGDKSVVEMAALAFTISATDPDGDTVTYSASSLPDGASFNATTRTFSWVPGDGQAGSYADVHFHVSDGYLTDTEHITITVRERDCADVNSDGAVNALDMIRVGQHWNETGTAGWVFEDVNKDGMVNVLDATLIGQHWTG